MLLINTLGEGLHIFRKISYFIEYFKYIQNPYEALKFKFGILDTCNLRIKNSNYTLTLHNNNSINRLMHSIPLVSLNKLDHYLKYIDDIDKDVEQFELDGINFINIYNSNFIKNQQYNYTIHLDDFFTDDEWSMVNFKDRHVIDIGANIGDTPLYFAKNGAEVIGFEPVKHLYDLALKNIELNEELSNKITLVNKGVGGKRGTLTFQSNSVRDYASEDAYEMEIISFQDLLNDYEFTPDILKMDCEGCEFEIILDNDLTMFNDIIFEHHAKIAGKDYKPLIDKLKKEGFKIDTYTVTVTKLDFEDIGIIHAYK